MTERRHARDDIIDIKLAPEWVTDYLWVHRKTDPAPLVLRAFGLREEFDFPLSDSLCNDLDEWDREFQAIYVPADPRESAFPSEEAERQWEARGRELAGRLAAAVGPDFTVVYDRRQYLAGGDSKAVDE